MILTKTEHNVSGKTPLLFDTYATGTRISSEASYYTYFRSHMALDDKTPAEKCGIKIEGNNKWITLIQNASKRTIP